MKGLKIVFFIALWVAACAVMDLVLLTESRAWVMCYGFGVGNVFLLVLRLPPYENNNNK